MKIDKIIKILGVDTVKNLEDLEGDEIKHRVVLAEQSMKEAQDELDANPKYQELKDSLKALSEGKKEVNKRQKAIIAFCLHLLDEK